MLHRFRPTFLMLVFAAMATSLTGQSTLPSPVSTFVKSQWSLDAIWDDGKAEVATYQGERVIEGAPRSHTLHIITQKEDLNREYNVKADWPHGQKPILTVIKQNQIATIPTPNYPHHYMSSVLVERDDPARLVKMIVSSQEWNGTTTKEFDFAGRTPQWTWLSYWDGEGSGSETLRGWPREAIFEEHLPLLVRTLDLREGLDAAFALAPSQITNKAPRPEPVSARLRVERPEGDVRVPAGNWTPAETWRIVVEAADGRAMEFVLADEAPRVLLAWSVNDGRFYVLRDIKRDAFRQIRDQVVNE